MKVSKLTDTIVKTFNSNDVDAIIGKSITFPIFSNTELNIDIFDPEEANSALVITDIGENHKIMNVPNSISLMHISSNGIETECEYELKGSTKYLNSMEIDVELN